MANKYKLVMEFECDDNINRINKLINERFIDAMTYNVGLKGIYATRLGVEKMEQK